MPITLKKWCPVFVVGSTVTLSSQQGCSEFEARKTEIPTISVTESLPSSLEERYASMTVGWHAQAPPHFTVDCPTSAQLRK